MRNKKIIEKYINILKTFLEKLAIQRCYYIFCCDSNFVLQVKRTLGERKIVSRFDACIVKHDYIKLS